VEKEGEGGGGRRVRICRDECCKFRQNRDRTGASNIGLQSRRLFDGRPVPYGK